MRSLPAAYIQPASRAPALVALPIDQIDPSGYQARTAFAADGLDSLVTSVRECGVINPLTVREKPDGRFELICGERRLRAARALELTEVPALVVQASDTDARLASLVENFQREELNPLDKANGLIALRQALGAQSWSAVGERVGLSKGRISQILSLLTLPPAVLELVAEGRLNEAQIRALRAVSYDERELVTNAKRVAQERVPSRAVALRLVGKGRGAAAPKMPGPRAAKVTRVVTRVKKAVDRALACRLEQLEQHALVNELSELADWCRTTVARLEQAAAPQTR